MAFARGEDYRSARQAVVSTWIQEDSAAAWAWVESSEGENRRETLDTAFGNTIWADPREGLARMARMPELADNYGAQWIGMRIATDVAGAEAAMAQLPPGRGRTQLVSGLAVSLAGEPEVALSWADTLLPGERKVFLGGLFSAIGTLDPDQALRLAADRLTGEERSEALMSLQDGWAHLDFEAAFTAMTERLDSDALVETIPAIFGSRDLRTPGERPTGDGASGRLESNGASIRPPRAG